MTSKVSTRRTTEAGTESHGGAMEALGALGGKQRQVVGAVVSALVS